MGKKGNKRPINIKDTDTPASDEEDKIRLSFLRYSDTDKKFHPNLIKKAAYMMKFSEKFRHICGLNLKILSAGSETDEHNHEIKEWDKVNKPKGFHKIYDNNLEDYLWWQFAITKGAKGEGYGRVIGFFEGNTFHVVWFDPNHEAYPSQ